MINKIKDFVEEHITLTAFIIVIALVIAGNFIVYKADERRYNDGICTECGGSFEYKGYIKKEYCYECDSCGVIVATNLRQEEKEKI